MDFCRQMAGGREVFVKRLVMLGCPFGLLCLLTGFILGYAAVPRTTVEAQGQPAERGGLGPGPAASRIHDGNAYVISLDDLKQKFPPADKTGKLPSSSSSPDLGWDPVYSLALLRSTYLDPAVKSPDTGNVVHWGVFSGDKSAYDAEMHEQKAQLYIITSGTGQVTLGGKPPIEHKPIVNGQHRGGPLGLAEGATAHKVKAGDIVVVPTFAWHQAQADPGQTLAYVKVDILTPRLMP
jgi:mannose-6-phosphate isomerase-like protein (cupin superfamily)